MTAVQPPPVDQRECAIYRFWVRHPVTGERVLGYIGETVRMPFERLMEHIRRQPWSDTIIGWEVDGTTYVDKAAVLAAERTAIEVERPLYNERHNQANPHRITPEVAQQQRRARDPQWTAPTKTVRAPRQRASTAPQRFRVASAATARWFGSPQQVKTALWAALWLAVACVVGRQAASGSVATWVDGVGYGCGIATVVVGVLLPGRKRRRRRSRR